MYVHPRIVPYVKASVYALILICPFMFKGLFRLKPVKANIFSYTIFTLTLVTALFIPPLQFNTVNGGNKVSLQSNSLETDTSAINNDGYNTESSDAEDSSTGISKDIPDEIIVDGENFVNIYDNLYNNIALYEGKKIKIYGFVYKSREMDKQHFVIARYLMACCTADLVLAGLYCDYGAADKLHNDQWVNITGTIKKGDFKGESMPLIEVNKVESMKKPDNEYVYP